MAIDWQAFFAIIAGVSGTISGIMVVRYGYLERAIAAQEKAISALKVLTDEQGETIAALKAENKDLRECITKLEEERNDLRNQLDDVLKEQKKKWRASSLT